jgi:hypothetical protein
MIQTQWWHVHQGYLEDEEHQAPDVCHDVVRITRELWQSQGAERRDRQRYCLELYYGCDWSSDEELGGALGAAGVRPEPTGYNVIQSITDTSVNRLVQNKIRPLILTEGGDAQQQQQAEGLQKIVEGTFAEAGVYGELGRDVCYAGHLSEAGAVKVYPDYPGMRLVLDSMDPCRFMVSRREAQLGRPKSGYYYTAIDRNELMAQFRDAKPEVLEAIRRAPPAPRDMGHATDSESFVDDVEVFEAWHLPSSRVDRTDPTCWGLNEAGEYDQSINPGHDGYRVLCVEGQVLIEEPWPFPYFPVAWFKPMRKARSFWSRSVPEVLAGAQLMINQMNQRVDAIMHKHARPIIYVWKQAKLNVSKITNGVATILEGNVPPGQAIQYLTPQSVPSEYLARIDAIASWAERQWGINEMAITGAKPAGIDHAPGMQHLSDELSARHTTLSNEWDAFHIQLATLVVDGHKMLADHAKRAGNKYSVVFGGKHELEQVDWKKADLKAAIYWVKVWPTNLLPQTPAAKANKLIDWMQAGIITAEQALSMIDHPDTESLLGDHVAKRMNVEYKIAKLLGGAAFEDCMPHPYMDLELCKTISSTRLNQYEAKGYDDATLEKLREFYKAADELLKAAAPPPPPPPAGMPPPPPLPPPPPGPEGLPMPEGMAA